MAIAIFTTWTTYGTWLPGDDRGWFQNGRIKSPNELRNLVSQLRLTSQPITLTPPQRQLIEKTIIDHCAHRGWLLHAVNCRTNHVHAAATAPNYKINIPREQFKAWCTRRLNEQFTPQQNWWTQRGWDKYIDDEKSLETIVSYINDCQDHSKI